MTAGVEYVECQNCGFVLLGAASSTPRPKRVDACPDCGGTDFGAPGSPRRQRVHN